MAGPNANVWLLQVGTRMYAAPHLQAGLAHLIDNRHCPALTIAEGDDQHVCPAAQDGPVAASELPVPIVNYMDLTNDTCRFVGKQFCMR